MNTLANIASDHLELVTRSRRLVLLETAGREGEAITELVAELALRGPLYVIAGGEWLPAYSLSRSIRRRTVEVKRSLDRVRLARPFTCYQLLDLLAQARPESEPILILDFLHHFYNPDIDLPVRGRTFQQCCGHLQRLAFSRPTLVFAEKLNTEGYARFFPLLASAADGVFSVEGEIANAPAQLTYL
jgi:hypothetical protein